MKLMGSQIKSLAPILILFLSLISTSLVSDAGVASEALAGQEAMTVLYDQVPIRIDGDADLASLKVSASALATVPPRTLTSSRV
jgi:hypothetical protein